MNMSDIVENGVVPQRPRCSKCFGHIVLPRHDNQNHHHQHQHSQQHQHQHGHRIGGSGGGGGSGGMGHYSNHAHQSQHHQGHHHNPNQPSAFGPHSAALMAGPAGMSPQGTVMMVYGLNSDQINCDRLFNLFCLYGNVVRVSERL